MQGPGRLTKQHQSIESLLIIPQSREGGSGSYTFDRVFSMTSRQSDIFDYSIRPTVDDILNGYNGTVFAYGQTGAGNKTIHCD